MKPLSILDAGMQRSATFVNRALVQGLSGFFVDAKLPVETARRRFNGLNLVARKPQGVTLEQITMGGVPVERITPRGCTSQRHLLYFHGGAFCVGAPRTHRDLTVFLAKTLNRTVWAADYRLAPEHPFPAGAEDCLTVYREMVEQVGSDNIALAGDSAGGNLVLVTLMMAREAGIPMPEAGILYSPWVDLRCCSESYYTQRDRDPMLTGPWLRRMREHYRNGQDVHLPLLSPLFGDLSGLPPLLLHVGRNEILLNDTLNLESRIRAQGGQVEMKVWESLWHVFHAHVQYLEVARQAVRETRLFLNQVNADRASAAS
ncbi:MAG: alpha/beta hydrolase [Ketobacteraceae bacterium]|nr:alpha/beta hydrolase [Ketobacteraceae bacterium]